MVAQVHLREYTTACVRLESNEVSLDDEVLKVAFSEVSSPLALF